MRKRKVGRKFGRKRAQRLALRQQLCRALVLHDKITTTQAKAKELRPRIERAIRQAQKGSLAHRRALTSALGSDAARKLFSDIAPKYSKEGRLSGFTRIVKIGPRLADGAKMAQIELI